MTNAVVFFGLPRHNYATLKSLKVNLIACNKVHVYGHLWFGGEKQISHTNLKQPGYSAALKMLSRMKSLDFPIKKIQLQEGCIYSPKEILTPFGPINYSNQLNMFDSICAGLDQIDDISLYDYVIFARTDLLLFERFSADWLLGKDFAHCGFWNNDKEKIDCDDTLFAIKSEYVDLIRFIRDRVRDKSIYQQQKYNLLFCGSIEPEKVFYEYGKHFTIQRRLQLTHYFQSVYSRMRRLWHAC